MKKVLILANNDVGLYRFRKELIQELLQKYKVYISLPFGEFVPSLEEIGCEFIETPINRRGTNPLTDFKLILHYKKIIKRFRPDVVLTYTIKPNVYGGLMSKLSSVPFIANITGLGTAVENKGILQTITLGLYRLSLGRSSCVFFQNKDNEQFITNRINTKKSKIIPGSGVNLNEYSLLKYPESNHINFVFIARVMKEKGIDQYLELAKHIRKERTNVTFHVVGECETSYKEKLDELNELNIIRYHGKQKDIKKIYSMSHCTIHPSYYPEGMSNVLLESSASGRPIITTDRTGCREIVDEEKNGYIVKQKDSHDLIEKVQKFLSLSNESMKEMGLMGRKKVEKEFDRNLVINEYMMEIEDAFKN